MSSDQVIPQDAPVKDHHGIHPETKPSEAESSPDSISGQSPATATETADDAVAVEQPADDASRPRPRLNPTIDPSKAKAVPSLDTGAGAAPQSNAAAPATDEDEKPQPEPQRQPERRSPPAEIPRDVELDANLEAEIAAAMAGEQQRREDVPAVAQPVPPAPGGEQAAAAPPRPTSEEELEPGMKLPAKVQSISGEDVFLDLGFRSPGVVSLRQFDEGKQPSVGLMFEVTVEKVDPEQGLIQVNLPRGRRKVGGNWEAVAVGQTVDCMVNKTNKGGLEVTVGGLRGFLPASQVELGFVSNLEQYVGQKLTVQITEVKPEKRNLVVSRRAHLAIARQEAEENIWKTLATGQTFTGTVKTVKDYGAFIDIGGVDGFLHVGEISWQRIRHPSDVLKEGQQVEVQVIKLDPEKKKISLGMKQLRADPWANVGDKHPPGASVTGTVTRTAEFGAFVELEQGLEGLIHISELSHQRVRRVDDVLKVGQEVTAKVLEVDPNRKRVSLSLKALVEKPEDPRAKEAEAPAEPYQRKHRGPLKGGTSSGSGGGLFGDPGRFG